MLRSYSGVDTYNKVYGQLSVDTIRSKKFYFSLFGVYVRIIPGWENKNNESKRKNGKENNAFSWS